jgi:hypothetical protein
MAKKRTSLDSILSRSVTETRAEPPPAPAEARPPVPGKNPTIRHQTAYLPQPVHEQLRHLAFTERAKMHDYLLEGLDLVFRKRGLPGIDELLKKPS